MDRIFIGDQQGEFMNPVLIIIAILIDITILIVITKGDYPIVDEGDEIIARRAGCRSVIGKGKDFIGIFRRIRNNFIASIDVDRLVIRVIRLIVTVPPSTFSGESRGRMAVRHGLQFKPAGNSITSGGGGKCSHMIIGGEKNLIKFVLLHTKH